MEHIRWLKELHGVKRGNNQFLGDASFIMKEATGLSEIQTWRLEKLYKSIPELPALISTGTLHGASAD